MPDDPGRDGWRSQSDHDFHRAVHAAAAIAYARAAWQPPEFAYVILETELKKRGIRPEPEAVYPGAKLISQGIPPPILRS